MQLPPNLQRSLTGGIGLPRAFRGLQNAKNTEGNWSAEAARPGVRPELSRTHQKQNCDSHADTDARNCKRT